MKTTIIALLALTLAGCGGDAPADQPADVFAAASAACGTDAACWQSYGCVKPGDCEDWVCPPHSFTVQSCADNVTAVCIWRSAAGDPGINVWVQACHPSADVTCVRACQ